MSYLVPSADGGFTFGGAVPGNAATFSNSLAAYAGASAPQYAPVQLTPIAATGGYLMNSTFTIAPSTLPAQPRQAALFDALAQRQLTYGPFNVNGAARPYPVTASMLATTGAAGPARTLPPPPTMFEPTLESPLLVRDPAPPVPAGVPTTAVTNMLLQTAAQPTYLASAWSGGGRAGDRRLGTWTASPFGDGAPMGCSSGTCGLMF
jgi:hypothetical protein